MSSFLDKATEAFRHNVMSAAPKISKGRTLTAQPVSAPSPAPSNASSKGGDKDLKRKREPQTIVYSQPQDSGYGTDSFTQVTYIIDFLKNKGEAKTFEEILQYLSKVNVPEQQKRTLAGILRKHSRIEWIPDAKLKHQSWDSGTFKHKPIINVRSKEDLLRYLQKKADAQGVSVKELKDGWPSCEDAIAELEAEHKVLVTRTKKDNHARMVWANDPTLVHPVDDEFSLMWHRTELPGVDDLVKKLLDAGQKPASEDPSKRIAQPTKAKEKKKRPPRKGGKTTNTHMEHLLKDYSHMRR